MDERNDNRALTRGGLIKVGAAAALAVGAGGTRSALAGDAGAGADASGLGKPKGGPAYFRRESYVPLIGTHFLLRLPEGRRLRVKLIDASPRGVVGESFSLLFSGRRQAGIEGGIYRLEHPSLGRFDLFVNPVGRGVRRLHLEAVVNRIAT
jgi:uncharacterized protein DUF6916